MNQRHHRRQRISVRSSERGSALIIVFVFAAIIAIMLYREMSVVVFEGRRQKEELLVERGHEYQRAVQLYYRKFQGRYPANIDMLENSNNMRFLRRRYTDPFTGKDDWRLLHAGLGGQLVDSKVKNLNLNGAFGQTGNGTGTNAGNSNFGAGSGAGVRNGFGADSTASNGNTGTGSSSGLGTFGDTASNSSDSDVTVAPVVKRAPAGNAAGATPTSGDLNQDPSIPLLPSLDPSAEPVANATAPSGAPPGNAAAGVGANAAAGAGQQNPGLNATQMGQNPFGGGSNQAQGQTAAAAGLGGGGTNSTTSGMGTVMGGAFAGVASRAKGHAIKKINDQTDYSLWEFWYDPSKDTSMGMGGNLQNGAGGQPTNTGAPGLNTPTLQNTPAGTQSTPTGASPVSIPPETPSLPTTQ